ncbi:MAG: hypothetical protein J6D27_03365 [Ruminiclostridium sp.]|nr:hypothetical protein [Ruminiclostridium sp.]
MKKRKSIIITTLVALLSLTVVLTGCETNNAKNESTTTVSTTVTKEEITTTTTTTTKPETTTTVSETTAETTTTAPETTTTTAPETTTTTAPETTTTTTAPETTVPAPQWTESECNKTMYINTGCYSRKEAVMGAETAKLYNVNDKVTITATTDTGYGKLSDGTFIHLDYLSDNKVTVTTTTTTKPQTEAPVASDAEQVDLTVYSARPNVRLYLDADCTDIRVAQANDGTFVYSETSEPLDKLIGTYSWMEWTGTEFKVVEYIKSKDCYKREDGLYVKRSDVVLTDPVEAMYHYPFDFNAIKQYIIDDAVNNYGLVYDPDYKFEGSTWFPPMQVHKNTPAWIFKRNLEGDEYVMGQVASSVSGGYMEAGDTFNVYIERVDLTDRKEQLGYDEGWLIYFLRG